MNSRKKDFLISNSIVVAFIILIVLIGNYVLISLFGFNQNNFIAITLALIFIGVGLYLFLSKPLFEPLFKSEEKLQREIKQTIHELNIPVSTIAANIQMLQRRIKDEKNIKRLERIKKANEDLLKLYSDMEYSIKEHIDRVDLQEFNLYETIEKEIKKFEDIKKDIEIKNSVDEKTQIKSDIRGFQKVLDNLLSNAIKYNKEAGYVNIEFSDSILVISNSGKTIELENLFDLFNEDFQENTNNKGFGLGLHIVKNFCDKNKIEIKISSDENETKIYLDLKYSLV